MNTQTTRRQILGAAVATVALPVLMNSLPLADAAEPTTPKPDADGWLDTVKTDALADVSVLTVDGVPVILTRDGKKVVALSRTCTHKGCSVKPNKKKEGVIYCPCHGAEYDLSGAATKGPATLPLPHVAIRLADKTIQVNVKQQVKPDADNASISL